jgi:predicted dehydrogenase
MQQKKINFALVGCGRVSKKHLEAISRIKNARLYAVCDIDFERMSSSAKQFSAIKTFSKYFELVKDKNIDVIKINNPIFNISFIYVPL